MPSFHSRVEFWPGVINQPDTRSCEVINMPRLLGLKFKKPDLDTVVPL